MPAFDASGPPATGEPLACSHSAGSDQRRFCFGLFSDGGLFRFPPKPDRRRADGSDGGHGGPAERAERAEHARYSGNRCRACIFDRIPSCSQRFGLPRFRRRRSKPTPALRRARRRIGLRSFSTAARGPSAADTGTPASSFRPPRRKRMHARRGHCVHSGAAGRRCARRGRRRVLWRRNGAQRLGGRLGLDDHPRERPRGSRIHASPARRPLRLRRR
jgi:hypothetical protein